MPDFMKQSFKWIQSVKSISHGHPVFLVLVDDNSPLVIKREAPQPGANINHAFKVMKVATPTAQAKALDAQEMKAINMFLDSSKDLAAIMMEAEGPDATALRAQMSTRGTWIKMLKAEGVMDLKAAAVSVRDQGDKTGIRKIAKALNNAGGFETLGMIVAVDLYNGNNDRCAPADLGYGGQINPRVGEDSAGNLIKDSDGKFHRFKVTGNLGNLLFAINKKSMAPIGLDAFDPNSSFSDIGAAIDVTNDDPTQNWTGIYLSRGYAKQRAQFAQDICDDIEWAMGPRNRAFSFLQQTRLNKDGPQRVLKGMEKATEKIIKKLQSMKNPPTGVASRLAVLTS